MQIPRLHKETALFSATKKISSTFDILADSITSLVRGEETYTGPDGETHASAFGTLLQQTVNNVLIKATESSRTAAEGGAALITSLINVATEGVQIAASKVNIEGATIFTSGRLSQQTLNNTYDAKGTADTATKRSQRIYYRSSVGSAPNVMPTAWVTATGNKYNSTQSSASGWTTKVPPIASDTGENVSKYSYLWTCEQREQLNGELAYTNVLLDESSTVIDGGRLITGSVTANRLNAQSINSSGILTVGSFTNEASASILNSNVESAASARSQTIYKSATKGTTTMAANTTWVTASGDTQNGWTTTRPTYSQSYPILFVATQSQTVAQRSTTTCSCTTPVIDKTTTVIDGGNIITNSITADQIDANNLNLSGRLTIGALTPSTKSDILNDNAISSIKDSMSGFTILWNYSTYSSPNAGEAYICAYDPLTNATSDANGWVTFNGTKRTITKQMANPNNILPYNVPIYIVCRLSSASATSGTNYMVWYDSDWKYAAMPTPTEVGGSWTWNDTTDIILGKFVEPSNEGQLTECFVFNPPLTSKHVSTNTTTAASANSAASSAQTTANTANNKLVSFRGICTTAAGTAAKTVACTGFVLTQGYSITVYNTTAQTYGGAITLNVNSLGAKAVWVANAATSDTNRLYWSAGSTVTFVYDGTQFRVADNPGSYLGSTCSVAENNGTKVTSVGDCVIFKGTAVSVPMTYANTATSLTLNVSSTSARNIYYGTSTIVPTKENGFSWLPDTNVIFVFDGKFWKTGNQTFTDGKNLIIGSVSADKLNVNDINAKNSLTIGALSTSTQGSILNSNITIGGRNILLNSDTPSKFLKNTPSEYEVARLQIASGQGLVLGQWYTLQIWGYNYNRKSINAYVGGGSYNVASWMEMSSNGDLYVAFTFKATATMVNASQDIRIYASNNIGTQGSTTISGTFDVTKAELERGNKPTDWTSAPEDVDGDIDAAAKTATNYIIYENPTDGIKVTYGGTNAATQITSSGVNIINNSGVSAASFGSLARLGEANKTRAEIDYHSLQLIDKEGFTYFHVSDLRDSTGYATITETFYGNGYTRVFFCLIQSTNNYVITATDSSHSSNTYTFSSGSTLAFSTAPDAGATVTLVYRTDSRFAKAYTAGLRKSSSTIGPLSMAEGIDTAAEGVASHAEGMYTLARGSRSHAEGYNTKASGSGSHAEGINSTASDMCSHAEGDNTLANGYCAHAEGRETKANGDYSHAEGYGTTATTMEAHAEGVNTIAAFACAHAEGRETEARGDGAHAEGYKCVAYGTASHAGGCGTRALGDNQCTIGMYNVEDLHHLLIVGNGTSSDSKSNALYLQSNGRLWIAGTLSQNSDRRLKTHHAYLGKEASTFMRKLRPALFTKDGERHLGFYAQDVQDAEPENWDTVTVRPDHTDESLDFDPLTLDYTALIAPLTAYAQQLERRVEYLESTVDSLVEANDELREMVDNLIGERL